MSLRPVLLPAEIRVREFDAKLLLACCLAERGVPCFIGQRTEIDLMAGKFPQSIYVAKGLTPQTRRHFVSARNFGHEIIAWDEEAICYLTREIYIARRWGTRTLPLVSQLIAWGEDNAELWQEALQGANIPIHILGNPRADLLRPEMQGMIDPDAEDLRRKYGRYILLNSNFGSANNMFPHRTRFKDDVDPKDLHPNDRIGFNVAQAEYKRVMFQRMLQVPAFLASAFPDTQIIVRPHPAENHAPWQEVAKDHANIAVIHEGSVLPWIRASACVVHSSCTTALEAYLQDVPAIALRFPGGHECDSDLPNLISYSASEKEDMPVLIGPALAGGLPPNGNGGKSKVLLNHFIASLDGPLACDRIADFLAELSVIPPQPAPGLPVRMLQNARVLSRKIIRYFNARRGDHPANPEFREHQFPELTAEEANHLVQIYANLHNRFENVRVRRVARRVFEVRSAPSE